MPSLNAHWISTQPDSLASFPSLFLRLTSVNGWSLWSVIFFQAFIVSYLLKRIINAFDIPTMKHSNGIVILSDDLNKTHEVKQLMMKSGMTYKFIKKLSKPLIKELLKV